MNQDSSHAQDTQIIDRDIFFGNPEISGVQLSPDGKYIAFMKAFQGIMNVWVKKFDEPFENAKLLTTSQRPLYGFFWTYDSKYILYVKDNDGDENLNIYAVDPAGMAISDGAPGSRNLTPMKEVAAQIYMVSKKNPDILMIGLNDRDKAWHDLYKLSISTGKLEMMYENKDRITGYDFDWDENMRVLSRTDEQGNTDMLRIDGKDKLTTIYQINVKESAYIAGWSKDNSKCYLVTNKGELNLSTAFLMDPVSGKMEKFESDPNKKVDFGGLSFDDNTRDIISTSYEDDKRRIYWKSKTWEKTHADLKAKFPGREVDFQSSTKDYKKLLIAVWGDKYAAEVFYYNVDSKELISQYVPKPKLKAVEGAL
ncbi:MAG: TolB family protein, partial [Flavobacteriales bacterium]